MNSVNGLAPNEFTIAQWMEWLPSVLEAMGSIPRGNSDFFFVPLLCHVDQFTFYISLPILRRLERVFRCYIVCETKEDYKEGCLMVWANYVSLQLYCWAIL